MIGMNFSSPLVTQLLGWGPLNPHQWESPGREGSMPKVQTLR